MNIIDKLGLKHRRSAVRVLTFDESNDEHKMVYNRLIQSLYLMPNQAGDFSKQEMIVALQDQLEGIGTKFKTEAQGRNGIEIVDAVRMNPGVHKIEIKPEAKFDLLKELFKKAAELGAFAARDSIKVRDYLNNIPSLEDSKTADSN